MPDSISSCVLVPLLGRSGRSQFIGTSCCFGGIQLVRYCKHFIILEPPVSTPWRLSPNRGLVIATEQCGEADIHVCNCQLFAVFSSLTCCRPLRLIWTAERLTARSSFAAPSSMQPTSGLVELLKRVSLKHGGSLLRTSRMPTSFLLHLFRQDTATI